MNRWVGDQYLSGDDRILGVVRPILRPEAFGDWEWVCEERTGRVKRDGGREKCREIVEELCNTKS